MYGKLPPSLVSIDASNPNGIYGDGDVIEIIFEYTSEVWVAGIPTLTMNTGCHREECTVKEVQTFQCASDLGTFALKFEEQYIMTIDANTTQESFKYQLESLNGIDEVTIHYSQNSRRNTHHNAICTSKGNTITVTFERSVFPQYDGDVPPLEFHSRNAFTDPRSGLSMGNDNRLKGVHNSYIPILSNVSTEVVKGFRQRDGTAYYVSGNGTNQIVFHLELRAGDETDELNVKSLNFDMGYIFSPLTYENVSTEMPRYNAAARYLTSTPSSLQHNKQYLITSRVARVLRVTSPNPNGVYTKGDSIYIHVIFDLPVKYYGDNIHLLLKPGDLFRKAFIHNIIDDGYTLVFQYEVADGDAALDLDVLNSNALILESGSIYRQSIRNSSAADITLPIPKQPNSLSYLKNIEIDTNTPQILEFAVATPPGVYTAGDYITLTMEFDYPLFVSGVPILYMKNEVRELNAQLRVAPLSRSLLFGRSYANEATAIVLNLQFNWPLHAGDVCTLHLPDFAGSDADVHIVGSHANEISAHWTRSTQDIVLIFNATIAARALIDITLSTRTSIVFSPFGVIGNSGRITYSVSSQYANMSAVIDNLLDVTMQSAEVTLSPATPGTDATIVFSFDLAEPLVVNDNITLHMNGFVATGDTIASNNLFLMVWNRNSSTLLLQNIFGTSATSFEMYISDYIPLSIPNTGVGTSTIGISAAMANNGALSEQSVPSVTHVCALLYPVLAFDAVAVTDTSGFSVEFTVGPDNIAVGDRILLTLPTGSNTASTLIDITAYLTGASFSATANGRVVTLTAQVAISSGTTVAFSISSDAPFRVPIGGITASSSFEMRLVSNSCDMASATRHSFAEANRILAVTSHVASFSSDTISTSAISISINFTVTQALFVGDVLRVTLTDFPRDIYVDPYDANVTAPVPVTVRYVRYLHRLDITLLSDFSPLTHFSLNIERNAGFSLPVNGIYDTDERMLLEIESISGRTQGIVIEKPCIGICDVDMSYSSHFIGVNSTLTAVFSTSQGVTLNENISFFLQGVAPVNGSEYFVLVETTGQSAVEAASNWNGESSILTVACPVTISACDDITVHISAAEFQSSSGEMLMSIAGNAANPTGDIVFPIPFPNIYDMPAFSMAEITHDCAVSVRCNLTFRFQSAVPMRIGYGIHVDLADFDASAAVLSDENFQLLNANAGVIVVSVTQDLSQNKVYEMVVRDVVSPASGVVENSTDLTYVVEVADDILTEAFPFTKVNAIRAVIDASVDFSHSLITSLSQVSFSFDINFLVTEGDVVCINLPGFQVISETDIVFNWTMTSDVAANLSWSSLNSTFVLTIHSSHIGNFDFYVNAIGENYTLQLPRKGYQDISTATIRVLQKNGVETRAVVGLDCIGVCSAFLSSSQTKAGYPSEYLLQFALSSAINVNDTIDLHLPGYSRASDGFVDLNCDSIAVSANWSEEVSLLRISVLSVTGSNSSSRCVIPKLERLRLPIGGISSEEYFWNMTYVSESLGEIEGPILEVSPVGILLNASMTINPRNIDEITSLHFTFSLSNRLSVGDIVLVTLPQYRTTDGSVVFTGNGAMYFTGEIRSSDTNIPELVLTVSRIAPAAHMFELSLENTVQLPEIGVNEIVMSSITVSSATCPISSGLFADYTPVGSVRNSRISLPQNRSVSGQSIEVFFDMNCPLSPGEVIVLQVPVLDGAGENISAYAVQNDEVIACNASWSEDYRNMSIMCDAIAVGEVMIYIHSNDFYISDTIEYADCTIFVFSIISEQCFLGTTLFHSSSAVVLQSSRVAYTVPVIGAVSGIELSMTSLDTLLENDVVTFSLPGFHTSSEIASATYSSNLDSFGNISLSMLGNATVITIPITSTIPAYRLITISLGTSNNITLPINGVSSTNHGITMSLRYGHNNRTFSGDVQTVQPVGYFVRKDIDFAPLVAGATTEMTMMLQLSDTLEIGDAILMHMPRFTLVNPVSLSGNAMEYFSSTWNSSGEVLSLVALSVVAKNTLITATFEDVFQAPINGLSLDKMAEYIIGVESSTCPVNSISANVPLIPFVNTASLQFIGSRFDEIFIDPDEADRSVLLYAGHDLNDNDIGAQVTIEGDLYTIRSVNENILEFEEAYNSSVVSIGNPSISLYTPDFRPALYYSGSNTNTLVFRYLVRRGDLSDTIEVHSPPTSNHIDSAVFLNGGIILRVSEQPSLDVSLAFPPFLYGDTVSINSIRPNITDVSSTSSGVFVAGDCVDYSVTFDYRVSVNISVPNSPALLLLRSDGSIATAWYMEGSGSNVLTFCYTVVPTDVEFTDDSLIMESSIPTPYRVIMGNKQDFTRRDAAIPVIDVVTSIPSNITGFSNISWIGNAPYVTDIYVLPKAVGHPVYSAGDILQVVVEYSASIELIATEVSGAIELLLNTGRDDPAVASLARVTNSSLIFTYRITIDDDFDGLQLHCTCGDHLQRTYLQMVNSSRLIEASSRGYPVSLLLAKTPNTGALLIDETIVIDNAAPRVISIDSNTTGGVYSPGTSVLISVQYSSLIMVFGLPRLLVDCAGSTGTCVAYYHSGNTTDVISYVYMTSAESKSASVVVKYPNAIDTSYGSLLKYSDEPQISALADIPIPGSYNTLAFKSKVTVDASPLQPQEIQSFGANILPLSRHTLSAKNDDTLRIVYFFPQEAGEAVILFNATSDDIESSLLEFVPNPFEVVTVFSDDIYRSDVIADVSDIAMPYVPEYSTVPAGNVAAKLQQWWQKYDTFSTLELDVIYDRRVSNFNTRIVLDVGDTLNVAYSIDQSKHEWFVHFDLRSAPDNVELQQYQLHYDGYTTNCIAVGGAIRGIMSLHAKLEELPSLRALGVSVTRIVDTSVMKVLRIRTARPALSPIVLASNFNACPLPISHNRIAVKGSGGAIFEYPVRTHDALVLRPLDAVAAGVYEVSLSSRFLLSEWGTRHSKFVIEHLDSDTRRVSFMSAGASPIPRVLRSFLHFATVPPGARTFVAAVICLDSTWSTGDVLTIPLPGFFTDIGDVNVSSSDYSVQWLVSDELLSFNILNSGSNCVSVNLNESFGLRVPTAVRENQFIFSADCSCGVITSHPFAQTAGLPFAWLNLSIQRPVAGEVSALVLSFDNRIDLPVDSTLNLHLPGFVREYIIDEDGATPEENIVIIAGSIASSFVAQWDNATETVTINNLLPLIPGQHVFEITTSNLIHVPVIGISEVNPPSLSINASSWMLNASAIPTTPVLGWLSSEISLIVDRSTESVTGFTLNVSLSRALIGPYYINIHLPMLVHKERYAMYSHDDIQIEWFEGNASFLISSRADSDSSSFVISVPLSDLSMTTAGVSIAGHGIEVSVVSKAGLLPPTTPNSVTVIPTIRHFEVKYVGDIFSVNEVVIDINLKLNMPLEVGDFLIFTLGGLNITIDSLNTSLSITEGVEAAGDVFSNNTFQLRILSAPEEVTSLALRIHAGAIYGISTVMQHHYNNIFAQWRNNYINSGLVAAHSAPIMPFLASALYFASPYADTSSSATIRIITTIALQKDDLIQITLPQCDFNVSSFVVTDSWDNEYDVMWDLSLEKLSIRVPRVFFPTTFEFVLGGDASLLLPQYGISRNASALSVNAEDVTVSLSRGGFALTPQPVSHIDMVGAVLAGSIAVEAQSSGNSKIAPLYHITVNLDLSSPLDILDEILLRIRGLDVKFDGAVAITDIGNNISYTGFTNILSHELVIRPHEVTTTSLRLVIVARGVFEEFVQCHDCATSIVINSISCPVQDVKISTAIVAPLLSSMLAISSNDTATIELAFENSFRIMSGTRINITIPALRSGAPLECALTITNQTGSLPLWNACWDDVSNVLSITAITDISPALVYMNISGASMMLEPTILYENDPTITYVVLFESYTTHALNFDVVTPRVLRSASFAVNHDTSHISMAFEPLFPLLSGDLLIVTLPGYSSNSEAVTYSGSNAVTLTWNNESSTLTIAVIASVTSLSLVVTDASLQAPIYGVNREFGVPLINVTTYGNYGPVEFSSLTPFIGIAQANVTYGAAARAGQGAEITITVVPTLTTFSVGDYFDIYLPTFWSTTSSCSDSGNVALDVRWFQSSHVLRLTVTENATASILIMNVDGLRIPTSGVSDLIASLCRISGQTAFGILPARSLEHVSMLGTFKTSMLSFTSPQLQTSTSIILTLQSTVELFSGELIALSMPNFGAAEPLHVWQVNADNETTFAASWSDNTLLLVATEYFSANDMIVLLVGDSTETGFSLPMNGVTKTAEITLSSNATMGPVAQEPVTNIHEVGFASSNIHYEIHELNQPIGLLISLQISSELTTGDEVHIFAPGVEGSSGVLSVEGGEAMTWFACPFDVSFENSSSVITLVATSNVAASATLFIHVSRNNGLVLSALGLLNEAHYINANISSLGIVANASLSHTPNNLIPMRSSNVGVTCDALSGTALCEMTLMLSIDSELPANSYLVVSYEHWTLFEDIAVTGNASTVFNATWRRRDAVDSLVALSIGAENGYLVADADFDYFDVNMSVPFFREDVKIISAIPRIIDVNLEAPSPVVRGDALYFHVRFTESVRIISPAEPKLNLRLLLNTGESAQYNRGNDTNILEFVYHVASPEFVSALAPRGPYALDFSSTSSVISAVSSQPANTTLPSPYEYVLRSSTSAQVVVDPNSTTVVKHLYVYSSTTIYFPGDVLDIAVVFTRPLILRGVGTPSLRLSGTTANGTDIIANYVNVSNIQILRVTGSSEESFIISYKGLKSDCIAWNDVNGLHDALSSLSSLTRSIPVSIQTSPIPHGYHHSIRFSGEAPGLLAVERYRCPYEPAVTVSFPDHMLSTLVFRYEVAQGDIFAMPLDVHNATSLIVPDSLTIYTSSQTLLSPADVTLPNGTNSLANYSSGRSFVTANVTAIRVYSHFDGVAITGDVITIIVRFEEEVVTTGYPYLRLRTDSGAVIATYYDNDMRVNHELQFQYAVEHGVVATPIDIYSVDALEFNGSTILVNSLNPIMPVISTLPAPDSFTALFNSSVAVNATAPPRIRRVHTDVPPGEYGAGQDIYITLEFFSNVSISAVNETGTMTPFVRLNTSVLNPAKMHYVSGSGSSLLTFLYIVKSGDFASPLQFNYPNYTADNICFLLEGGAQFNDTLGNLWVSYENCTFESDFREIVIDTEAPRVIRVDSESEDGTYYPGEAVDVSVVFTKPVMVTSPHSQIELFIPHQEERIFASYVGGNKTANIQYRYVIPDPPYRTFVHPNTYLDYAGAASLLQHLHGATFYRLSTRAVIEAEVLLPAEDESYLKNNRYVLIQFRRPEIVSVTCLNISGVYTAGDTLVFNVTFSQPVMVHVPPVFRLETGESDRDAHYFSGSGSRSLFFKYTIQPGDKAAPLDYVDTRLPPYNMTNYAVSLALRTDIQPGNTGRLPNVPGARSDDIVLYPLELQGGVFRLSDHALVAADMSLPLPGTLGSLSVANIIIDTIPSAIAKLSTSLPNGTYGRDITIPIEVKFTQRVVVTGEPRLLFFISNRDRYAVLKDGNNTDTLSFAFTVDDIDNTALFDYKNLESFILQSPYDNVHFAPSPLQKQATVLRHSQSPTLASNTTMPWITYIETVVAPTSISGSGHYLRLAGDASAFPVLVSLVDPELRSYAMGDVIDIRVVFSSRVMYSDVHSYIVLNDDGVRAYFTKLENETSAIYRLTVQSGVAVDGLSYIDAFSLRTVTNCDVHDVVKLNCAAQNLPPPKNIRGHGDELSYHNAGISLAIPEIVNVSFRVHRAKSKVTPQLRSTVAVFPEACDASGGSWVYDEAIEEASSSRIIVKNGCPNHFHDCQTAKCTSSSNSHGIQQTVVIPLLPKIRSSYELLPCGAEVVGIAMNGVPIYSSLDEQCNDIVSAKATQIDKCGGLTENGVYRYHVAPVCLLEQMGLTSGKHSPQIGWALDGFPIYGGLGPNGVTMQPCSMPGADAIYCLDECNGYAGTIEEDDVLYRYYISGPVASGSCSEFVTNGGSCEKSSDPCCISIVPPPSYVPYTLGCIRGCQAQDGNCVGSAAYTDSYEFSIARRPTVPYNSTVYTTQAYVDARQAVLSSAAPTDYLPAPTKSVIVIDNSKLASIVTGDKVQVILQFSDAVTVVGKPLLAYFVDDLPVSLAYIGAISDRELVFEYVYDAIVGLPSTVQCSRLSRVFLNSGSIWKTANFIPIQAASLDLRGLCCENCVEGVQTPISGKVLRVFASQNGTFSQLDTLEIYVEFSTPVVVVGTLQLELQFIGKTRMVRYHGRETNYILKFTHVITESDAAASLDYASVNSLQFLSNGYYDGVYVDHVYAPLLVDLQLPLPGSAGSLGRSNNIIIDNSQGRIISISAVNAIATAGEKLCLSLNYNVPVVAVTTSFYPIIGFNITASDNSLHYREARYLENSGSSIIFAYEVQASDPTGPVMIADPTPLAAQSKIAHAETLVVTSVTLPTSYINYEIARIDNVRPVVESVMTQNISSEYPFGVGDTIYIRIAMSSLVFVEDAPVLWLRLNAHTTVPAYFHNGSIGCASELVFVYIISDSDHSYQVEYDGVDALVGGSVKRCMDNAAGDITADMTLPSPFTRGSLGYCCRLLVDAAAPYVSFILPLKRAGVYGLNEQIAIMVRFTKPVVVSGVPLLHLYTGSETGEMAIFNESFKALDVNVDIKDTDVIFIYTVQVDDSTVDLHHFSSNALQLNNGTILHATENPVTPVDLTLRDYTDHELLYGKVERQWKFGYPRRVEVLVRDLYHTDPSQLKMKVVHDARESVLINACCEGGTFGRSIPRSKLGNNASLYDSDTGMGTDFLFSDTRAVNIALKGTANQSSTEFEGVAHRAIDGVVSPVYGDRSAAETQADRAEPWWQVHLPRGSQVRSINIWPRTPQIWIPAIVGVTIKAFDQFPRGRFKLQFSNVNIDESKQGASYTTSFIDMGASAEAVRLKISAIANLAQLSVTRETIIGDGVGVEKGHGWKYLITFHNVEIAEPRVSIVNETFLGGVDIIDGAPVENILEFQLNNYVSSVRRGTGLAVSKAGPSVGGDGKNNSWLIPYWVMIFEDNGEQPPTGLSESISTAIWKKRFDSIDILEQIVLGAPIAAGYVKVQREGVGALSLAEVEVFEDKLEGLKWYDKTAITVPARATRPYQSADSLKHAFVDRKVDGRWILQLETSGNISAKNIEGYQGSEGTLSDWVLLVTDMLGVVHTYYQDLRAVVTSNPKYGTLHRSVEGTLSPYGDWREAFEVSSAGAIVAKKGLERALGVCNGVDTTGQNGERSGYQRYRYCTENFGVAPALTDRKHGDYPEEMYLRNERIVFYEPNVNYYGPDYFTYKILDDTHKQSNDGDSEVTLHVRHCKTEQSSAVHRLCTCEQSEQGIVSNRETCSANINSLCSDAKERYVYLNMCLSCEVGGQDCLGEIVRAVAFLKAQGECDTLERPNCDSEIRTAEGRESRNYLSLMSYPWNGPFSSVRDDYGNF